MFKRSLLILAAAVICSITIFTQQSGDAYPGQSNHAEPPVGWNCERPNSQGFGADHPCSCSRMAMTSPDGSCAKDLDGTPHIMEDPKCLVFCHQTHCKCPVMSCGES